MKTKEEKNINDKKFSIFHKLSFLKTNWLLLVILFFAIIAFSLGFSFLASYLNKKSSENDITNTNTTSLFSVDKIVCYSNAYGINNDDTQGRWNLNLSQYTDIAIYINSQIDVSSMYIDNVTFSNPETGSLSLSYLTPDDFGKSPNDIETTIQNSEKIELNLKSPITLRYLNQNIKENCIITDTEKPLVFDGSILKRGKVTISSLKNTISFNLHVVDSSNQEYTYPISISINLENKETGESIYDGSYNEELNF